MIDTLSSYDPPAGKLHYPANGVVGTVDADRVHLLVASLRAGGADDGGIDVITPDRRDDFDIPLAGGGVVGVVKRLAADTGGTLDLVKLLHDDLATGRVLVQVRVDREIADSTAETFWRFGGTHVHYLTRFSIERLQGNTLSRTAHVAEPQRIPESPAVQDNPIRSLGGGNISRRSALAGMTGVGLALAAARASAAEGATPDDGGTDANTKLVLRVVAAISAGDASQIDELLSPDYAQHQPGVPAGREGFKQFIAAIGPTPLRVLHTIAEGDLVVIHSVIPGADPAAPPVRELLDLFRIAGGQVAEHWGAANVAESSATPVAEGTPAA